MGWPLSQDYNEAVQVPAANFADPELKGGQVAVNALGLPMPHSGNFADVYQIGGPRGDRWAVKCFTREVPRLRERYEAISRHLRQANLPFTVDFTYLEKGILVAGKWYPVLKMEWVEGLTLNQFVARAADKPATLESLLQMWARMGKYLRAAGLAHADLQHGNVLLVPDAGNNSLTLKLVDYDGMWVPALAGGKSGEVGHAAYQHPRRVREQTYSREVDRFPLLLVATALSGLKAGGRALWEQYDNGDNLLFTEADLQAPTKSPLFRDLLRSTDAPTVALAKRMIDALRGRLESAPLLDELMPEEAKPAPVRPPSPKPLAPSTAAKAVPVAVGHAPPAPNRVAAVRRAPKATAPPAREKAKRKERGRVRVLAWMGGTATLVILAGVAIGVWALQGERNQTNQVTQPDSPSSLPITHSAKETGKSTERRPPDTGAPVPPTEKGPPKDALVVLTVDQPGAKVLVDGQEKRIVIPGDNKPIKINVKPGPHELRISKNGFEDFSYKGEFKAGESETITVRLQELVVARFPAQAVGGARIRVEGKTLVIENVNGKDRCDDIYFGDTNWDDYDFQVDAKKLAGGTHSALCFRHRDLPTPWRFALVTTDSPARLALQHLDGNEWKNDPQSPPKPIGNNEWYSLKVSVRGKQIQCYLGSEVMFKKELPNHLVGGVGLHANGGGFVFRNIKVTAPNGKVLLEGLPKLEK